MRKILSFILVLFVVLSLFGCRLSSIGRGDNKKGTQDDLSWIIGYVMNIDNGRILVIDPVAKNFSSTGGQQEFYNAVWFSQAPKNIKIGDKVKVWYDIMLDSYPGQSEVKDIEILPVGKPDGADLNESQALRSVLPHKSVVTVRTIKYDKGTDKWFIELKDTFTEEIYNVEVIDK